MQSDTLEDLRSRLASQAHEVATAILGSPNLAMSNKRDLRFGRRGSLSVAIAGANPGVWFDHEMGAGGDLLALIRREHACGFKRACEIASVLVGLTPECVSARDELRQVSIVRRVAAAASQAEAERQAARRRTMAAQIWDAAWDIAGTLAAEYLHGRGLTIADHISTDVLRFHPSCPFGEDGCKHPAMVALMRDAITDEPAAVHRTALRPDGAKFDRKVLGAQAGSAIKLTGDCDVAEGLCIAEGVETALSAMAFGFAPMWCVANAGQLAHMPVLPGIEALTIIVDHDATGAGQRAAAECSERWRAEGRDVYRVIPDAVGADFNDVLREARHAA